MNEVPEHAREPVPGLPEELPAGERMLWQGRPDTWWFAVRALHVRKVAIYFAVILLLRATGDIGLAGQVPLLVLALSAVGILYLLAWLMARTTLYTLTDKRVVMRFGIAVPVSLNLPFSAIDAAELRRKGRGAADIVLVAQPAAGLRLSWAVLWPHVRPWRTSPAQPMLRCLDDADAVADLLGTALQRHAGQQIAVVSTGASPGSPTATGPKPTPAPDTFPKPPLFGAAALLATAVLGVILLQLVPDGPASFEPDNVVSSATLDFEDRSDGAVLVYDAKSGVLIDELPAGSNNFLRATLRGLVRGREAASDHTRAPFDLYRLSSGQLLLVDPVTGQQIDLWAFGETNARSFERLLHESTSAQVKSNHNMHTLVSRDEPLAGNQQERMQ